MAYTRPNLEFVKDPEFVKPEETGQFMGMNNGIGNEKTATIAGTEKSIGSYVEYRNVRIDENDKKKTKAKVNKVLNMFEHGFDKMILAVTDNEITYIDDEGNIVTEAYSQNLPNPNKAGYQK